VRAGELIVIALGCNREAASPFFVDAVPTMNKWPAYCSMQISECAWVISQVWCQSSVDAHGHRQHCFPIEGALNAIEEKC
jgi:hypothetical protein